MPLCTILYVNTSITQRLLSSSEMLGRNALTLVDLPAISTYTQTHTHTLTHLQLDATHTFGYLDTYTTSRFPIFHSHKHPPKRADIHNHPPSSVWIRSNKQVNCLWRLRHLQWPWLTVVSSEAQMLRQHEQMDCTATFSQINQGKKNSALLYTASFPTE